MMKKQTISNIKLGVFVLAGFTFLVLMLFLLGKNRNLFGNTYTLKATFDNAQGLMVGNNVRYSGIQAGTVKKIEILNDTLIEISMSIENKMLPIIKENAIVSIGTDGFVGNKVVNILPSSEKSALAGEDAILASKKSVDTDKMLQTLAQTNDDIAIIVEGLKTTVARLNNSDALWDLLNDSSVPEKVHMALDDIKSSTARVEHIVNDLDDIVQNVKAGEGSLGSILMDTVHSQNLNDVILKFKSSGNKVDSIAGTVNEVVLDLQNDIKNGKGPLNTLLNDASMSAKLSSILDKTEKAADGLNENMEALKHNFLFRGYFRRLERREKKAEEEKANAKKAEEEKAEEEKANTKKAEEEKANDDKKENGKQR